MKPLALVFVLSSLSCSNIDNTSQVQQEETKIQPCELIPEDCLREVPRLKRSKLLIENFQIVRSGGGSATIEFSLQGDQVVGKTLACQFRDLSQDESTRTVFQLEGELEKRAAAILANQATFASKVEIRPWLATGTWLKLNVNYSFFDGVVSHDYNASIENPLVILAGKVDSMLLNALEEEARAAAADICQ